MTIKITKVFEGGKTEATDVDEWDFPIHEQFVQTLQAMEERKCHSMIVQIPEGLQILYTITEKKSNG